MIKQLKSCVIAAVAAVIGFSSWAEGSVDVEALLQESALWLDASDPTSFEYNASGGVTKWINRSTSGQATYGDAVAYTGYYGTRKIIDGAPAYDMGATGSKIDLKYGEIAVRTFFLVGDFENKSSGYAPLLGHSDPMCGFHRGDNGEVLRTAYKTSYTWQVRAWVNDKDTALDPFTAKPTTKPMDLIVFSSAKPDITSANQNFDMRTDQLSRDRAGEFSGKWRDGGRTLNEVIIFTRELSDDERNAVYDYLYEKWREGGWKANARYDATVTDGTTADWFALPWTYAGMSAPYPEGERVDSTRLTASGASVVTLSKPVSSLLTEVVNGGANSARLTLAGPSALTGLMDLSAFNGTVCVHGTDVTDTITLGQDAAFELTAAAGETWTSGVYKVTGSGTVKKTGAGTVVHSGVPTTMIDIQEGVLALLATQDTLAKDPTPLLVKSETGGILEKRGAGMLTVAKDQAKDVQIKVMEGSFSVHKGAPLGTLRNIIATREQPFYVARGATASFDCNDINNGQRLPDSAFIFVDGGTLILRGSNPFNQNALPDISVTGGVVEVNHNAAKYNVKFKSLTMQDSEFKFTGTSVAYNSQGLRLQSVNALTTSGVCRFDLVAGNSNLLYCEGGAINLEVQDGTTLWNLPISGTDLRKTGAGVLQLGPAALNSAAGKAFVVAEGALANGVKDAAVQALVLEAGAVLKAVDGDPLQVIEALTLPEDGTVTLDLTGIDFTDREEPVSVISFAAFTSEMAAKVRVTGLPEEGWEVSYSGGIAVTRVSVPVDIVWNTGDGEWGAKSWNNDPNGYAKDGFHRVSFADRATGDASAPVTVTIPEDRRVNGFDFTAAATPYRLTGAGVVTMPKFEISGAADYTVESPIIADLQNDLTFAASTADQAVLDVRSPFGAITVPSAAGGKVTVGMTDGSSTDLKAIAIGGGKTLELRNARATAVTQRLTGSITGDETTRLRFTKGRFDTLTGNTAFAGHVEVADGGALFCGSGKDTTYRLSFASSPADPFYIHGAGSKASFHSYDNGHLMLGANACFRVEDGGTLVLSGVNLQEKQDEGAYVTVSNATFQAQDRSGSHIHIRTVELFDRGVLELTGTDTAYSKQGLVLWGKIIGVEGTSAIRRAQGNPNSYHWWRSYDERNIEGTVEVREGARMVFDNVQFGAAPHKTGEGTLVLGERASSFGSKTLKLDEGYLLANAMTETVNANLTTVQVADGAGFDLSERTEWPWTPTFAISTTNESARTKIQLKVPEDLRGSNRQVIAWETPPANLSNMTFVDKSGKRAFVKTDKGVFIIRGLVVIFQ